MWGRCVFERSMSVSARSRTKRATGWLLVIAQTGSPGQERGEQTHRFLLGCVRACVELRQFSRGKWQSGSGSIEKDWRCTAVTARLCCRKVWSSTGDFQPGLPSSTHPGEAATKAKQASKRASSRQAHSCSGLLGRLIGLVVDPIARAVPFALSCFPHTRTGMTADYPLVS